MDKINDLRSGFKNPDRRYGVYQIIHGGAADPSRAAHFDECGFAGIVGNIPYSREFPDNEKSGATRKKACASTSDAACTHGYTMKKDIRQERREDTSRKINLNSWQRDSTATITGG